MAGTGLTAFVLTLSVAAAGTAAAEPVAVSSVEAAVQAALANNPDLKAAQARIDAALSEVAPKGAWNDPMVGLEYSNMPILSPWPGGHPMSGIQLKAQQTFPFPGKLEARVRAAEKAVEVARADRHEVESRLAGRVRAAWWRLSLVRQLREITRRHIELTQNLIDTVRAAYETGQAGQHNLLRLEVLAARLRDELGDFDRAETQLVAALNAAMHRPPDAPIVTSAETPSPPQAPNLGALVQRAESNRGALKRLRAEARRQRAQAETYLAETRPDVTGWLGYRIRTPAGTDPGANFVTLGVSIPLPWFWNDRRWGARAQAAQARAEAADAAYEAALDTLRADLASALARLDRARAQARTYARDLIPAAKKTLDATLAAYRVGRADFATLYQAEVELLTFERTLRRAQAEAALAWADVLALTGTTQEEPTP